MRLLPLVLLPAVVCFVAVPAVPQNPQQPAANGAPVIRTESPLVLVDTVVTDKKGNHLADLPPGEFHVFEDNIPQSIQSVYRESEIVAQPITPTHTVLLLGRMDSSEMIYVRDKVAQFVTDYASPMRLVAIINYLDAGNVKVMQTFTADPTRLKQAFSGLKSTGVVAESTTPEHSDELFSGPPSHSPFRDTGETTDFTGRNLLAAVRNLAKSLASVPGRKAIVLMAPTFDYNLQPHDFPSTVHACNKANVAVYTVDMRGNSNALIQNTLEPLVSGTGGFMDDVPNDAPRALQRVAQEQDDRYVIAYVPSKSQNEMCHRIRVKVDRNDTTVRARSEYCTVKPNDPLAGTEVARNLEAHAAGSQPGNMPATMQFAYFYTAPGVVRVHVASEVSTSPLVFERQNGKFHVTLNVLGIAYRSDGAVAARFTDAVDFDFDGKDQLNQFKRRHYFYQNQFAVATGAYNFTLVF
ncbi:MAG: VWA domain-containing protein, partial [Candidatus Acidiferrum sp.]